MPRTLDWYWLLQQLIKSLFLEFVTIVSHNPIGHLKSSENHLDFRQCSSFVPRTSEDLDPFLDFFLLVFVMSESHKERSLKNFEKFLWPDNFNVAKFSASFKRPWRSLPSVYLGPLQHQVGGS